MNYFLQNDLGLTYANRIPSEEINNLKGTLIYQEDIDMLRMTSIAGRPRDN